MTLLEEAALIGLMGLAWMGAVFCFFLPLLSFFGPLFFMMWTC